VYLLNSQGIDTARDEGRGTGDKGNANTARDEGKGIREQPIQNEE